MLQRLYVNNFTVFAEANFDFGPGLNVVVGTNGTGKSHVLKLGYAVLNCQVRKLQTRAPQSAYADGESKASSPALRPIDFADLDEKLVKVFRPSPSQANELIRRNATPSVALIKYELDGVKAWPGSLTIEANSTKETPTQLTPSEEVKARERLAPPILIPAKEILTLGWMRPASGQLVLPLDEAYLDLLTQLGGLSLRQPEPAAAAALQQLTAILGGEVEEDNGRFYLVFPKEKRLEMNMVAEGLRKFGTLQKLLANGSLTPKATLFWDEPEANLNPALLRKLATVLAELARQGFQIILATHSLFLLKELHILSRQKDVKKLPLCYFGLNAGADGATTVTTVDDFEKLPDIVALDAEMEQADTLTLVFAQDDADHHGEGR